MAQGFIAGAMFGLLVAALLGLCLLASYVASDMDRFTEWLDTQ